MQCAGGARLPNPARTEHGPARVAGELYCPLRPVRDSETPGAQPIGWLSGRGVPKRPERVETARVAMSGGARPAR